MMMTLPENYWANITPVILSGGLGTRLQPVVADRPKVLAQINSRPFITYLFDQLAATGFQDVVLCAGYKADILSSCLGTRCAGLEISYSREPRPLGTAGALRYALPLLKHDVLLVMNGDSYLDFKIEAFVKWYLEGRYMAAIVLNRQQDTSRFGKVNVDKKNRVLSFKEKAANAGPGFINAGCYLLEKALLERIPDGQPSSLEHDFFPKMVSAGLAGYCCEAAFIDIGTPESYDRAAGFFKALPGNAE